MKKEMNEKEMTMVEKELVELKKAFEEMGYNEEKRNVNDCVVIQLNEEEKEAVLSLDFSESVDYAGIDIFTSFSKKEFEAVKEIMRKLNEFFTSSKKVKEIGIQLQNPSDCSDITDYLTEKNNLNLFIEAIKKEMKGFEVFEQEENRLGLSLKEKTRKKKMKKITKKLNEANISHWIEKEEENVLAKFKFFENIYAIGVNTSGDMTILKNEKKMKGKNEEMSGNLEEVMDSFLKELFDI